MIDVAKLQQTTARYEFADGIRDFEFAFWVVVTGFYAWIVWDFTYLLMPFVEFIRTQGTLVIILSTFVLPIGIPFIISRVALHVANEYVRRRWLWRNTGFIKPKAWIVSRFTLFTSFAIALTLFVIGIFLAIQLKDSSLIMRGLYVGIGLEFAYVYQAVGVKLRLTRYRTVSIVGAISTLIIAVVPMSVGLFCWILSLFWAVLLIISGFYGMTRVAAQQKAISDAA